MSDKRTGKKSKQVAAPKVAAGAVTTPTGGAGAKDDRGRRS